MPDLDHDTTIALPRVTVLKASAGSGKTFRLTQRYVQFLLSEKIPKNGLRNLMAITFSNNAAREMRRKILAWLKLLALKDPARLAEMAEVTSGGVQRLSRRADELIETILSRFSEFQVRTIDSFMAALFRASALDFGFGPEIEIALDPEPLVDYAWSLFLREAGEGSATARLLDQTVASVLDFSTSAGGFDWNPAAALLEELRGLEGKLSGLLETLVAEDPAAVLRPHQERISRTWEAVAALAEHSGLEPHGNSRFAVLLGSIRERRFSDLVAGSLKNGPVKKPRTGDRAGMEAYARIESAWQEAIEAVHGYAGRWARAYYQPFLRLHAELSTVQDRVKRAKATVFISDIGRQLAAYLTDDMVPDVYFRIGERIWHYLVDEFQDTAPLQWKTLFPLVENSLAMDGSLFVVGDTKQAIYGFRQADYTIMRSLEAASPFPSAPRDVRELSTNWRSRPRLVQFAREVFHGRAVVSERWREAARRSGLDDWHQEAREGHGRGYVEVEILRREDENPPEREKLARVVESLRSRGWGWEDVALLAPRNSDIVRATSWLNDLGVPVISFSSLDVRTRTVAGEMLALLAFLDSPPDDLAFATFLLGSVLGRTLAAADGPGPAELRGFLFARRADRPLYKAFQRAFPHAWKKCFAGLFRSAGYLPLYDLVSEACILFDVFSLLPQEEATFAKLLEAVKDFEGSGENSLREFLGAAGAEPGADDASRWAIDVPPGSPSVRAMTIHKAKGLGFPVVIVLLYGETRRGIRYALLHEGDDDTNRLVKITRDLARHDAALEALHEEETTKAEVDALNRLYVALTRAEREMYVIGVRADRDEFPFDLLPVESFAPSEDKENAETEREEREPEAVLSHAARPVRRTLDEGRLGREERRRGELAHRMLELVGQGTDPAARLAAAADRAAREARCDLSEARALVPGLAAMLAHPSLAPCFTAAPGRVIRTEQELCDPQGRLVRMDRLVVDPGRVTVVEYKTGEEEPAAHEGQVRDYTRILAGAWPGREIRAMVAYVDLGDRPGVLVSIDVVPAGVSLVEEVARRIETAGDPSDALVVFPGKRPAHFLRRRLAQSRETGFVPPRIQSMDELVNSVFEDRSEREGRVLPLAEPIDAVAMLYEIQVAAADPLGGSAFMSLDAFFPLGLKIHSDLEELAIEEVAPEDVAGVQPLVEEAVPVRARQRLKTLSHFYERFYEQLAARSLSTRSSRYVCVARSLEPADIPGTGPVIFAGFYALTKAERAIFLAASRWPRVQQVFQDGPGLREKIADLLPARSREAPAPVPRPQVQFTVSPDTHGQVAALNAALARADDDTLIVLPAAETLFPILRHCLSRFEPETYNVSLPYPLHRTPLYGFFNALMEVVSTMDGPRVYVPAYVSFVLHPYVKNIRLGASAEATRVLFHALEERLQESRTLRFMALEEIEADHRAASDAAARLAEDGGPSEQELRAHLADIHHRTIGRFRSFSSIKEFAATCVELVTWVHDKSTARDHPYFTPFSESIVESLEAISRSLVAGMSFTDQQSYFTLLRTYLRSRHLSFPGTPLHGMQVLGGLETRSLQFGKVFVLDANEGVFPEAFRENTLLPFSVRQALGLSTSRDQEDLADYHFQLLAAGARTLHLFYVENSDKQRSRFVERLLWEEQKKRRLPEDRRLVRSISYRVSLTNSPPAAIQKTPEVASWLGTVEHSATSLDAYLECPLKFYYRTVLRLSAREDLSGEIESREVGTLVHVVLARFFQGRTGRPLAAADLDPDALTAVLDEAFTARFGSAESGANRLLRDQANRHLRDFLCGYQAPLARSRRVEITSVEHDVRARWKGFALRGRLDRVEMRDGKPFLIDYKTTANRAYYRMRLDRLSLEERESWHRWIPTLQLPIYVLLHSQETGSAPADIHAMFLLLGRNLMDTGIELPLFEDPAAAYESWAVLERVLEDLLKEIVSEQVPFSPAADLRAACPRCDFTAICGTSWLKRG